MLNKINYKFALYSLISVCLLFFLVGCGGSSAVIEDNLPVYTQYFVNSINHRGYYTAPENTLSAYRESANKGFFMVECDVQFTKDNKPVLLHDDSIDRTSNGTGRIDSLTLEEVRAYDFGGWKSEKFIGEKIPTFEEFIFLCRNLSLHPYIEMKYDLSNEQVFTLVETVIKFGMINHVTWISFNANLLKAVIEIDSKARIGYIVYSINEVLINCLNGLRTGTNSVFFDCSYSGIDSVSIEKCVNESIPIEVWTVDNEDDILNLDPYISGVTSNSLIAGKILQKNPFIY